MALVINGVEPTAIIVNGVGLDAVQVSKDNKVVVVWVFAVPTTATSKPTNALNSKANLSDLPIKAASLSGTTLYLTL